MQERQADVTTYPMIALGDLMWTESRNRAGYCRDFDGVGRAVITRVRGGSWVYCVRGSGGRMAIPWATGFQTAWECAAGCRDEIGQGPADLPGAARILPS